MSFLKFLKITAADLMSTKPGSMPVSALRIPLNVQSINKPASLPLAKDCRNCVFGLLNTIVLMFVWNLPVSIGSLFLMS